MNLKQAAHRLDVHYQTAYRWVRDGELAAVKIGNRYEISEAAIEQFSSRRASLASVPVGRSDVVVETALFGDDPLHELRVLASQSRVTAQPCFDAGTVLAGSRVGDVAVLRVLDDAGEQLVPVSSFAVAPEIRASVIGAVAAAGAFGRDTPHWSAAEQSGDVHVVHHMPRDRMRDLFGEQGRFVGRGVPVLAAAVAPMFIDGAYAGGLLAVKSGSYAPFSEAETALLRDAAVLCGQAHKRATAFRQAWRSNTGLNERVAAGFAGGGTTSCIDRNGGGLLDEDRAQAVAGPDGSILVSNSRFDDVVAAMGSPTPGAAAFGGFWQASQVRDVVHGVAAQVDIDPLGRAGPRAIVSAVRGPDAELHFLVVDVVAS